MPLSDDEILELVRNTRAMMAGHWLGRAVPVKPPGVDRFYWPSDTARAAMLWARATEEQLRELHKTLMMAEPV